MSCVYFVQFLVMTLTRCFWHVSSVGMESFASGLVEVGAIQAWQRNRIDPFQYNLFKQYAHALQVDRKSALQRTKRETSISRLPTASAPNPMAASGGQVGGPQRSGPPRARRS